MARRDPTHLVHRIGAAIAWAARRGADATELRATYALRLREVRAADPRLAALREAVGAP